MSLSQTKVDSLIAEANAYIEQKKPQAAFEKLKEASQLDADNNDIRNAISKLQIESNDDKILKLLKQYGKSESAVYRHHALEAISARNALGEAEASKCMRYVLEQDYQQEGWSDIMVKLITRQVSVRKDIAARLTTDLDGMLDVMLKSTESVRQALFQVLFEASIWHDKQTQYGMQTAIFKGCVRLAISSKSRRAESASNLMVRQLILAPSNVAGISTDEVVKCLLWHLDSRLPQKTRGQALLAATKIFETSREQAEESYTREVLARVFTQRASDLIIASSAVAAMFPAIPEVCAKILLTEGFLPSINSLLSAAQVQEIGERYVKDCIGVRYWLTKNSETNQVQNACLDLLSAACVDKACRESIMKQCHAALMKLSRSSSDHRAITATLVLAKLSDADAAISAKLVEAFLADGEKMIAAVEGLAYVSLRPAVKEQMINNTALLEKLISCMSRTELLLSIMTVLMHLTAYRPAISEEQKKMTQLKAYANSSKPTPEDPLDNAAMVSKRCKILLDHAIATALVKSFSTMQSTANLDMLAQILNSLAREAKHRPLLIQQGVVKMLFQASSRTTVQATRNTMGHALARILISTNPEHLFGAAMPATTAVALIVPLLKIDPQQDERDLLPTFEALLALTNLASMSDASIGTLIVSRSWETLENDLFLSDNRLIQRASVELVCNLMLVPEGVAKFADGSDNARRRMHILLALADVDDLATRRAAGGALAMLTEWDTAVVAILAIPAGIKLLLTMCADSSDEVKHRGLICALNSVSIPGGTGDRVTVKMKEANATTIVTKAIKESKSTDVLAAGEELLRLLLKQ